MRDLTRKAQRRAISTVDCDRFRQIGEERRHLLRRFEIMLGRQPAAILGGHHLALGDADQRVMGGIVVGRGEIGFVGGDERQIELIGEIDRARARRSCSSSVP